MILSLNTARHILLYRLVYDHKIHTSYNMSPGTRVTTLLALSLLTLISDCPAVRGQDGGCYQEPPGEMITTVPDEFGCAIFDCYNQTTNATQYNDYDFSGWILADLRVVNGSYDDGRITVREEPESFTIRIQNISRPDLGLYHCMLTYRPTGEYYLIRFGLNSKGPFFITGWEQYKMNTIVGCSAFGGFLVLTGLIYLFCSLKYVAPEDEEQDDFEQKYVGVIAGPNSVVPGYVPAIENGKFGADGNWTFAAHKDSPADLRKRAANSELTKPKPPASNAYQGFQNKAFDSAETKEKLADMAVGAFFDSTKEADPSGDTMTQF